MLEGQIEAEVRGGIATFAEIQVTGTLLDATLQAACSDMADFTETATSEPFSVHPYPRTGKLRTQRGAFNFDGSAGNVANVLNSMKRVVRG